MNNARNVTKDRQEDVDQEVGTAATLKEDSERRENDGKDDLANIAGGLWLVDKRHTMPKHHQELARHWGADIPGGKRHFGWLGLLSQE